MLREDRSSICNSSLVVIYIWSRYFNPTAAYQVYSDLPQLFFPLVKKNSFGKIIHINPFIYNIFKMSFASYLPGHSILNLKICCPLISKAEGLYHCRGNTWPTELAPLTSPCHFAPLHPQQSMFNIPAKAPGNASGLGTCLLLYFYILEAKITSQFNIEPFHLNLHRTRPGIALLCSNCLPRWSHLSPASLTSDTASATSCCCSALLSPCKSHEKYLWALPTQLSSSREKPQWSQRVPRRPQMPQLCPTMQLFGTAHNTL